LQTSTAAIQARHFKLSSTLNLRLVEIVICYWSAHGKL